MWALRGLQINRDVENLGADAFFPKFLHDLGAGFSDFFKINLDDIRGGGSGRMIDGGGRNSEAEVAGGE